MQITSDKIEHYAMGYIALLTLLIYLPNIYLIHIIILAGNCGWEWFWHWRKWERWCWWDWISVELGAISAQMIHTKRPIFVIIGVAIALVYIILYMKTWKKEG